MVEHRLVVIGEEKKRLDQFLSEANIELTRTRARRLIDDGLVWVNDKNAKPSAKVAAGDVVRVTVPAPVEIDLTPENIPLDILFEDEDLVVVDKPPGMVVHPAPGHPNGTLVNALLFHCKNLSGIGGALRPGIVHRLDKDTSGVMVVSKSDRAHAALSEGFQNKTHRREYEAFCLRKPKNNQATYETLYGRHPVHRKKFSSKVTKGKHAITHIRVIKEYSVGITKCSFVLETGRTHQIRVHSSDHGHPIIADKLYGRAPNGKPKEFSDLMNRHALHAKRFGFVHPCTGNDMEFESPLPKDMAHLLKKLEMLE